MEWTEALLNSTPKRICIVRLSAIGDTCHALAVVRRLQDNWPGIEITWIIGKTEASLMRCVDDVEFIIFDKSAGGRAYKSVEQQLNGRTFDAVLCMHASFRANRLYRRINSPVRLGFDRGRAKDFQWLFTNRRIPAAHGEHALEAMMGFATAIGAKETPLRWDLHCVSDISKERQSPDRPLIVISPCSSARARNFRNWSVENYVRVINYLSKDKNVEVVLTGGRTEIEEDYGRSIESQTSAVNLIGKTSLQELLSWIAAARCVVCPDSGPAHMATTVGTPVIGLYATSDPRRTGPYLSQATVVNRYPDAASRFLGKNQDDLRWGQRIRDPEAMSLITFDDVIGTINEIL